MEIRVIDWICKDMTYLASKSNEYTVRVDLGGD